MGARREKELTTLLRRTLPWLGKMAADHGGEDGDGTGISLRVMRVHSKITASLTKLQPTHGLEAINAELLKALETVYKSYKTLVELNCDVDDPRFAEVTKVYEAANATA